jgi:hypothetical protein
MVSTSVGSPSLQFYPFHRLQWPDAEADPLPQADVNDLRQRQKVSGAAED